MENEYQHKFQNIVQATPFDQLPQTARHFVRGLAFGYRFTQQELRQVAEIALDLHMWGDEGIIEHWPDEPDGQAHREKKKQLINQLKREWEALRSAPNRYPGTSTETPSSIGARVVVRKKERLGLGFCPVASPRTRCCNLLTLDAVDNCGYGCSYCSIRSFFSDNKVFFDRDFGHKLASLPITPDKLYHIGTGQSSDSLMWGNSNGVLDDLMAFAARHSNVILELKTKSANIGHLLKNRPPVNLICTWSLNPQTIINNEEHATASLEKRLEAARKIADQGSIIGFHFHPMIHYQGWREEYGRIFSRIQSLFRPDQVAMISLGTLTFIKPVIRKIRESGIKSQILKLPLVEADGKLSYPDELKRELFSFAYDSFAPHWKDSVFFYLCMENQRFWQPVFGYDYHSNDAFEEAMKESYMNKIRQQQARNSD